MSTLQTKRLAGFGDRHWFTIFSALCKCRPCCTSLDALGCWHCPKTFYTTTIISWWTSIHERACLWLPSSLVTKSGRAGQRFFLFCFLLFRRLMPYIRDEQIWKFQNPNSVHNHLTKSEKVAKLSISNPNPIDAPRIQTEKAIKRNEQ